jgi:hypothetical protein
MWGLIFEIYLPPFLKLSKVRSIMLQSHTFTNTMAPMAGTDVIKLDFEQVGLQGRGSESAVILKAYDSSLTSSCSV